MENLTVIHLSDLHISKESLPDIKIVLSALKKDLTQEIISKSKKPSFIVFSGDLVYSGDMGYKDEFQFALVLSEFIKPILDFLELEPDCFFMCPGNHDIQREKVDEIYENGLKSTLQDNEKVDKIFDQLNDENMIQPFVRLDAYNVFKKHFTLRTNF